jgi:hypothetical protein
MNRRQQWQLAALALALAAGTARAQTSCPARGADPGPGVAWEFTTAREGGEARLQMQTGPGATATCESITLRIAGTPVTLTADGQKVRVRGCAGERGGLRIEASADRVTRRAGGEALTLEGQVQARYDHKGQAAQIIKAEKVTFNLDNGSIHVEGAGSLANTGPAPISFDTGFPVGRPEDQPQVFTFWQGFFH